MKPLTFSSSVDEFRAKRNEMKIVECGEDLIEIPASITRVDPHPYQCIGAPYDNRSPFYLRKGVVSCLEAAAKELDRVAPGYRILLCDGFRPLAVQDFMIAHSIDQLAIRNGLDPRTLSSTKRRELEKVVLEIWAPANLNPLSPPPHSTGAAVDVTLLDPMGRIIDMGSKIDSLPPECLPDYFAEATDPVRSSFHRNRELLRTIMEKSGFRRIPHEYWHFSFGDQTWAYLEQKRTGNSTVAKYGRID